MADQGTQSLVPVEPLKPYVRADLQISLVCCALLEQHSMLPMPQGDHQALPCIIQAVAASASLYGLSKPVQTPLIKHQEAQQ